MITKTNVTNPIAPARVDFIPELFEDLIQKKGRRVQHERTLICPCKSYSTGQQSSCLNCGGTGYIFSSPQITKMVITNMDITFKLNDIYLETQATINISASKNERLAYNDRIILLDSISWYTESLSFWKKKINGVDTVFARTAYPIKEIEIFALEIDNKTSLKGLTPIDYTYTGNVITLAPSYAQTYPEADRDGEASLFATIRYSHHPYYMITELKRESMEQYIPDWQNLNGQDQMQRLPVSAIGKKMHDVIPINKIGSNSDQLLVNNFNITSCKK